MAYRLPPLNTLRLFEAAGRHESFKLAADELGLTPSAVSHGILGLEDWLGALLFARGHRGLTLTATGAAYLEQVRAALELLARATAQVPGRRPTGRLSVSVAPTFGRCWLVPNLGRFHARHPDIEVTLDTVQRQVEFPRDGVDLAIRRGGGEWPGLHTELLTLEDLVPVVAPSLAAQINSPADLARQTLLHVSSSSEDWQVWADLAGVAGIDTARGPRFDTIMMAQEAAAQGLGIAIGRLPLSNGDLAAGRLVPVLGPPVRSRMGYWLVTARETLERPEVAAFRAWIRNALTDPPQPV